MDEGKVFIEIVEVLSKDVNVVGDIKRFVDYLEIKETNVVPLMQRYDLGHRSPYELMRGILSEWISKQGDSATVANLRRILIASEFVACAETLGYLENAPGPIKRPAEWYKNSRAASDAFTPFQEAEGAHCSRNPPPEETRTKQIVFGFSNAALNFIGRDEELEILNDHFHSGEYRMVLSGSGGIGKTELAKKFALAISGSTGNSKSIKSEISGEASLILPNSAGQFCQQLHISNGEGNPIKMEAFVVISDTGGFGKRELTTKFTFAATLNSESGNSQIVKSWFFGESPQSLLNSIAEFCLHLNLTATDFDGKSLGIEKMLKNIMTELKSSAGFSKWLVIIDNLDEPHEEFETAVRTLCGFGSDVFLLVTSRRREIFPVELALRGVTEMKLEDSLEFVRKALKITDNSADHDIQSLCNQLGNFPLVLNQAVAYIKQQQKENLTGRAYGVQNYLDELSKAETFGLDKNLQVAGCVKEAMKMWNITLDKIKKCHGATALDLLDVMAFINPEEIHAESLCKFYRLFYAIEVDINQIQGCLTILLEYSLISSCNATNTISIHPLVQYALKDRMAATTGKNQDARDVELLKTFWRSFDSFDSEKWNRNEMATVLRIWNHCSGHQDFDLIGENTRENVFYKLHDLGMVNESFDFASEGCDLLNFYQLEDKEYFLMSRCLAIALREKGQYEASLEKFTFVYEKFEQLCGEDDKDTLETGHWIATVLRDLGKHDESLEWVLKILQSKVRIYGENHEATMKTKHNLALSLAHLGRGEEALKMNNEILDWTEVHLGKGHPLSLSTRHNVAICYYDMGNYAEALEIFQEVFSSREEHFGVDHPETLKAKGNLAATLEKIGEIEKAIKIAEEVLVTREKILGPDHQRLREICYKLLKRLKCHR